MSAEKNWQFELEEYIKQGEPGQIEKSEAWQTAIGLQAVGDNSQSVNPKAPKSQFDTLECTLEELAVLELIYKNPSIKQKDLVAETGKSLSTVKRIMESLQKKEYIRRVDGKRYSFSWSSFVQSALPTCRIAFRLLCGYIPFFARIP